MRRLMRLLLPVIVLVPVIAINAPVAATPPDPPTCAGVYSLDLSAPMVLPSVGPSALVGFSLSPEESICSSGSSWPADHPSGWISGWCGAATGWGQLPDGRSFNVVWAGSSLTIVGMPVGSYVVVPASIDCTGAGGTSFIAVGGATATADACAGSGTMHLSSSYSWLASAQTASFSIFATFGACATTFGSFMASGWITGNCYSGTGWGTTSDGQSFDLTWTGTPLVLGAGPFRLILSGNVIGSFTSNCGAFGSSAYAVTGGLIKLR